MPPAVRIELISKMAAIEHRLAYGTSDKLQLGALCGAFAGGCKHNCGLAGGVALWRKGGSCGEGSSQSFCNSSAHIVACLTPPMLQRQRRALWQRRNEEQVGRPQRHSAAQRSAPPLQSAQCPDCTLSIVRRHGL